MGKRIDVEEWAIPFRATELLGVPDTTLRRAITRGDVRSVVIYGDTLLVNVADVDKLARSELRPGPPPAMSGRERRAES